ncbi:MAG: hypothetical protein LQ349_005017 [Xanthoria aureola]|nr:MAG: hypothetical protein LQ349_005017 [Xanthoria aureola]
MDISDISIPVAAMTPHWKPIIDSIPPNQVAAGDFDPDQHLQYESPAKIHTMKDLSLPENTGISPVAVSEPFRLFTTQAIHRMRAEVLSQDVWENCQYSSNLAQCQLRGFAARYAPFVYDAWKNPETLSVVSKIAGLDLVTE